LRREKGLNSEDLADLALLRLDAMVAIDVCEGIPGMVHMAHLLPPNHNSEKWRIQHFRDIPSMKCPFLDLIRGLEDEMQKAFGGEVPKGGERAILVHASPSARKEQERSIQELELLARSAGVEVVETIRQHIQRYHPAHLIGLGKLREILMQGLYLGATMVIFDQNLSPVQVNKISQMVDLKVIDRTQLILDIFAKRARSREGKIQVELAQLKYLLPRLVGKGTAMSRLTGGIGGRGPGEKKLEVDRRRVKQRIHSLEKDLKAIARRRHEQRKRRARSRIFQISLVGYTNAGKSTLLNALTRSNVFIEDKPFATLDPTSKRAFIKGVGYVLVSDTVGFIRQMPEGLKAAFRSTLEELSGADLLVHVVDLQSHSWEEDRASVDGILRDMGLEDTARLTVYNKVDVAPQETLVRLPRGAILISAKTGRGISELIEAIRPYLPRVLRQDTRSQGPSPSLDHRHFEGQVWRAGP